MFEAIGDLVDGLMWFALISVFVLMPLAIWKLVEILIWIYQHFNISISCG